MRFGRGAPPGENRVGISRQSRPERAKGRGQCFHGVGGYLGGSAGETAPVYPDKTIVHQAEEETGVRILRRTRGAQVVCRSLLRRARI